MGKIKSLLTIGDVVRIERDEKRYPSRGSWSKYKGREATIVQINHPDNEIGVKFGAIKFHKDGTVHGGTESWFLLHEVRVVGKNPQVARLEPGFGV